MSGMGMFLLIVGAILFVGGAVVGISALIEEYWPAFIVAVVAFVLGSVLLIFGNGVYSDAQQEKCENAGGVSVVYVGRGSICVSEDGRVVAW
jgi:hypothetical protein